MILVSLLLTLFPASAFAYRGYCVYAGAGEDLDAHKALDYLNSKPASWQNNAITSNKDGGSPGHDDLSNYADDSIGARFLYFGGHGFHDGFIPFWTGGFSGNVPKRVTVEGQTVYDFIRFDAAPPSSANTFDKGYAYNWETNTGLDSSHYPDTLRYANFAVGAHWLPKTGAYTRSESRWNNNVRHVMFFCCSQLNNENGPAGSANRSTWNSAAAGWAHALCGTPNMAHEIMGYRYAGPGDGTDVDVVKDFFEQQRQNHSTLVSWRYANVNRGYSANWAWLGHSACVNEKLPGWGTSVDPVGAIDIDIYYDGADASPVLSQAMAPTPWPMSLLSALGAPAPAWAAPPGTDASLAATLSAQPETLPPLQMQPEQWNVAALENDLMGSGTAVKRDRKQDPDGHVQISEGPRVLEVFPSGAVSFEEGNMPDSAVRFSAAEAVTRAKQVLQKVGGVPPDASEPVVSPLCRQHLDIQTNNFESTDTLAYTVAWRRRIDGVAVTGYGGDEIRVEMSNAGADNVFRLWRKVRTRGAAYRVMPTKDLMIRLRTTAQRDVPKLDGVVDSTECYFAPTYDSTSTEMTPAWRVDFRDKDRRYFDARSGAGLGASGQ